MKKAKFTSLGLMVLLFLAMVSCQKEDATSPSGAATLNTSKFSTKNEHSASDKSDASSCNCEYEIISHSVTGPLNTAGHAEYTLYTKNGVSGFCSGSSCPYMGAVGWGPCEPSGSCYDLISTLPTSPAFLPFNCAVPAFTTLQFDFIPEWWLATGTPCTTEVNPSSAAVTFRIRCQDAGEESGCSGQGYYSSTVTFTYPIFGGGYPSYSIRLGGCGCDPS